MKKIRKILLKNLLPILAGVVMVGGIIYAWSEPASVPPSNNAPAPINTSANPQTKTGNFTSGGNITANQFCLGGVCISAWPSGGGGGGPQLYVCPNSICSQMCGGSCLGQLQAVLVCTDWGCNFDGDSWNCWGYFHTTCTPI